jgi:hypothetical protein
MHAEEDKDLQDGFSDEEDLMVHEVLGDYVSGNADQYALNPIHGTLDETGKYTHSLQAENRQDHHGGQGEGGNLNSRSEETSTGSGTGSSIVSVSADYILKCKRFIAFLFRFVFIMYAKTLCRKRRAIHILPQNNPHFNHNSYQLLCMSSAAPLAFVPHWWQRQRLPSAAKPSGRLLVRKRSDVQLRCDTKSPHK